MGKVKVVNRVDILSFAISSEEEDTEKVDADSHSDSSSEDELVKLEVGPTRQCPRHLTEPQEPTCKNARQNAGKHWSPHHVPKSALQENASCNHIIHVVMRVVTFYSEKNLHSMQELINKVHKLYFAYILHNKLHKIHETHAL